MELNHINLIKAAIKITFSSIKANLIMVIATTIIIIKVKVQDQKDLKVKI